MSNYVNKPVVKISQDNCIVKGYEQIFSKFENQDKIIIECYPGTDIKDLENNLKQNFTEHELIFIDDYSKSVEEIQEYIKRNITEDRVFGFMSNHQIEEFYDQQTIKELQKRLENTKYIVFGFGAIQLYDKTQTLVYSNMARWEIQLRFRKGAPNWKADNESEDAIRKFKRGYFFEWRVADRIKKRYYQDFDYMLDLNDLNSPKMISATDYRLGLEKVVNTPFRLVPFFDPGVWGGQWMKEKCNLDKSASNYAWSFDGVPEENSINLEFGQDYIEIPAIDVVLFKPQKLMGQRVHARFGTEFPIRFDFLDTIDGQNLSLQVHPLTEYIQEKFGMNYTQDESYYILDVKEGSDTNVYLGFKNDVDQNEVIESLNQAQDGVTTFDVEKYINKIPCKKHDHFLIPAGTVHCSGADTMVLEISSTPYIFTFKLWDWDRLGLDGKPRPIHLEHGEKVLDFTRDTDFVMEQLANNFTRLSDVEERTGLHEREFIESRRFFTDKPITHKTEGVFHMLNLIEGDSAIISSPTNAFEDYEVHYAETFIVPANIDEYTITPNGNFDIGYIKAYVRG